MSRRSHLETTSTAVRVRRARALLPILLVAGAAAVVTLTGLACRHDHAGEAPASGRPAATARYHCPMHPTYVSDKPGNCPICGMKLVPLPAGAHTPAPPRRILYYRSPMDPSVHSDTPAKDSMGMDFIPVYEDEQASGASSAPGRTVVALSPERRQLLGVRSEPVREGPIERIIRTVGSVAADERRIHHVHTKYEAYVEHLYVDFTGKFVNRGDHLVALFSPELVATQEEYLLALRARARLKEEGLPAVAQRGEDLLEATRQRLLLWDIAPDDIAAIERAGKPRRTLDLHSDVSGFVLQKNVVHGMRVMPADTLFDIADLSRLWILADVYETDLPLVRLGMTADVSVPYLPGKIWRGPVTYVAPTVEEKTRTVKVRIEVNNVSGLLRPDMFADVSLKRALGRGLTVPETAVIDTGERRIVFVERADGSLEPREVVLGVKVAGAFQVLRGLVAGERVVVSANFLLDSESSLKAAIAAQGGTASGPHSH